MRNGEKLWKIVRIMPHRFRKILFLSVLERIETRIAADQNCQFNVRHERQQIRMVRFSDERTRRKVSAFSFAGIIEIHRQNTGME